MGEAATAGLSSPPALPQDGRAIFHSYKAAGLTAKASSLPVSSGFGLALPLHRFLP